MQFIDPEEIRLSPGQALKASFWSESLRSEQIGLFIRPPSGLPVSHGATEVAHRGGLIKFDDILLVVTMVKYIGAQDGVFDIWWNYHQPGGPDSFKKMASQERLSSFFYDDYGKRFVVDTENSFRKFFSNLNEIVGKTNPWTEIEFDRAVRRCCSQFYPRESLWEMVKTKSELFDSRSKLDLDLNMYDGVIPEDLKPFYLFSTEFGHCLSIIPSNLEDEADKNGPAFYLTPAPVRTVLRCGIRWLRGYPVASIPFIPGHGLAAPPEDYEF
jgi:hypothetical protein